MGDGLQVSICMNWCGLFMTLVCGGGMQYSHFIFSPEGVCVPVVGPHLGVKPKGKEAKKASQ